MAILLLNYLAPKEGELETKTIVADGRLIKLRFRSMDTKKCKQHTEQCVT
jgi:hypothetical protein